GAIVGGMSNPLYALIIAYANDYLDKDDMAAASGGLLFINGLGAIAGPLIVGLIMDVIGDNGYWLFTAALMLATGIFGLYRSTQRSRTTLEGETVPYSPVSAASTPVVAELAQEVYIDAEEELGSSDVGEARA
ncbi:MAG: MFS transporter, partial [Pseudomonadota bacterium]